MKESVYLTLGCFGRVEDGFTLCPSCENRILAIDDSLVNQNEMWDYFEAIRLIDKPMLDINGIRHLIFNLQEKYDQKIKRLWTEKQFHAIERFIHMHKQCGLLCKLVVVIEDNSINDFELEPVKLKIEGSQTNVYSFKAPDNSNIRSRR